MSATIAAGPASLYLNIATPLEADGTTPRDDIAGVKVWYSTSAATFIPPAQGTLAYDGTGLSITLSSLNPSTTYYIRYALISEIDPDNYLLSPIYSATPQSEPQVVDITGYTGFTKAISGTITPTTATLTATQLNITSPVYAWTITGGTPATASTAAVTITPSAGATTVVARVSVTGTNTLAALVKSVSMPVVSNGSNGTNAITVVLSNEVQVFPASITGAVSSYTGSGTQIRVYEGATELTYDGIGTANGTWRISSTAATNITVGTTTDSGTFATIGAHSGVADATDTSSIVYNISGKNSVGTSFSISKNQKFTKAKKGDSGTNGQSPRICYIVTTSGTAPTTPTPAIGDAAPTSWSFTPTSNLTSGQYMYQSDGILTGTIGDVAQAVVVGSISNTALTINSVTSGTVVPGLFLTGGTIPANTYIVSGGGSIWTLNQSVPTQGPITINMRTATAITWSNPYLSNLKVGSLSAISADLGTITAGDLQIGSSPAVSGTTMTGNGSHLYSDGKFAMGTSSKNFVFNGTDVFLNGFLRGASATTSTGTPINNLTTLTTFTTTKINTLLVSITGTAIQLIANPNITVNQVDNSVVAYIYNNSGTQVAAQQVNIITPPVLTSGAGYVAYSPLSFSLLLLNLPAGTYTVRIQAILLFRDFNGNIATTWTQRDNNATLTTNIYEAKI